MPTRVKLEVERFLTCGDARFGFVEVSCADCAESRVVAFCCKGRGWCPSCTTRRALDTGVHLESVLPRVAHRQWTLSLPMSVRFLVVKKPKLLKRLEVRLVKAVWRWQRGEARRHGAKGALTGGRVCFWQWFGSQLQLTPHLHLYLLVPSASARRPPASGQTSPHLSPRLLRPQRQAAPPRHPTAPAAASARPAQLSARGGSSPQNETAPPGLGPASPEDLRHRPAAVPLRRSPHHQEPPLHPQAGRGAPGRTRRLAPLSGAPSGHSSTAVAPRDVTAPSACRPAPSSHSCARCPSGPAHVTRNGHAAHRVAAFHPPRGPTSSLGHPARLWLCRVVLLVLHQTRKPLRLWFRAITLWVTSKRGLSAKSGLSSEGNAQVAGIA